jgi:photosystem II stability/assembly factor-like uncharacterized protein
LATRAVSVAVDPATPAILYAAVAPDREGSLHPGRPGGMFKSLDGGRSWTEINNGLGEGGRAISSIAIAGSQPSTVYVTAYAGATYYVFSSDDGGSTWRGGTQGGATAVAVSPTDPRRVYAAGVTSGFNVSTDGGRTWRRTSPPLSGSGRRSGAIVVNPARPSEVYVSHEDGVKRSRDGGETCTVSQLTR